MIGIHELTRLEKRLKMKASTGKVEMSQNDFDDTMDAITMMKAMLPPPKKKKQVRSKDRYVIMVNVGVTERVAEWKYYTGINFHYQGALVADCSRLKRDAKIYANADIANGESERIMQRCSNAVGVKVLKLD